jgi:arylsulfatase A-like enzyme
VNDQVSPFTNCAEPPPMGYPDPPGPPPADAEAGQLPELGPADEEETWEPGPDEARPNVLLVNVDNLGYGELGCYGGGVLRGSPTDRIDAFAGEGMRLQNFAPEAQCTPSRSALMTGRMSIRSGTSAVPMLRPGGLVNWERTIAFQLGMAGYTSACLGKWHIGETPGRWPTDHGFDYFYGPGRSWDEALWERDPSYDPARDGVAYMYEATRRLQARAVPPKSRTAALDLGGNPPQLAGQLTVDRKRNMGDDLVRRAKTFMSEAAAEGRPFFLYFNDPLMHLPCWPSDRFKGATGNGDWADCLAELDGRFGELLDYLDWEGLAENTIVIFCGDNGPEEVRFARGDSGPWSGSYFTGTEASLRTPCLIRYPGVVPAGQVSNEIVHITDVFPTVLRWCGARVPADRVIDGRDQREFLEGRAAHSAREGFLFFNGSVLYGVKWRDYKLVLMEQRYLDSPALKLATPHIVNLLTDPKERESFHEPWLHTWTLHHFARVVLQFAASVAREPLVPLGAPLDFVPGETDWEPPGDPLGLLDVEPWGM